jgi:segregation and condensation protein B
MKRGNPKSGWSRRSYRPRVLADFIPSAKQSFVPTNEEDPFVRDPILARVEATLLASREPVSPRRLVKVVGLADTAEVRRHIHRLSDMLRSNGSAFYVEEIAGGYQLLTRPEYRPWLEKVCRTQSDIPLSGPMLETLAIVAYRQPICRADVEAIRGVQVGEILRHLLDKGLIRLAGKDDSLGRPYLYGTTQKFLQAFGLRNLHELPMVEALAKPTGKPVEVIPDPTTDDIDEEDESSDDEDSDDDEDSELEDDSEDEDEEDEDDSEE